MIPISSSFNSWKLSCKILSGRGSGTSFGIDFISELHFATKLSESKRKVGRPFLSQRSRSSIVHSPHSSPAAFGAGGRDKLELL